MRNPTPSSSARRRLLPPPPPPPLLLSSSSSSSHHPPLPLSQPQPMSICSPPPNTRGRTHTTLPEERDMQREKVASFSLSLLRPATSSGRRWISSSCPRTRPRARECCRAGMGHGRRGRQWLLLLGLAAFAVAAVVDASEGDADPLYQACVEECQKTGFLKETSVKHCMAPSDGQPADKSWYTHEPLYLQWKGWNCKSECRYHCMMEREKERKDLGLEPVKYHGKWPLTRASVFQQARESFLKDFDSQKMRLPDSSNIGSLRKFIKAVYVEKFIKAVYVERRYAGWRFSERPPRF